MREYLEGAWKDFLDFHVVKADVRLLRVAFHAGAIAILSDYMQSTRRESSKDIQEKLEKNWQLFKKTHCEGTLAEADGRAAFGCGAISAMEFVVIQQKI